MADNNNVLNAPIDIQRQLLLHQQQI